MGACGTKENVEPDESPTPMHKLGNNTSSRGNSKNHGQTKVNNSDSDPHSDTDTNGARGTGDDLMPIVPLNPPINNLLVSTGGCGPGSDGTSGTQQQQLNQSAASFSPSLAGGSFSSRTNLPSHSNRANNARIAVSSPAPTLLEPKSGQEHGHQLHNEEVTDLCLSDVDGEVISSSTDKTLVRYNWKSRTPEKWNAHAKSIERVYYANGNLFSSSKDASIRQWQSRQSKESGVFRGHTLPVTALLVHGDTLISGSRDYTLRTWSISTRTQLSMKAQVHNVVTCLKWFGTPPSQGFASGSLAAVSAAGGAISNNKRTAGAGDDLALNGAGYDPHCFLQGSEDPSQSVRVWDARTMHVVASFPCSGGRYVRAVTADPYNSNQFVCVTSAGTDCSGGEMRLWDRRYLTGANSSSTSGSALSSSPNEDLEPLLSVLAHSDMITSVEYLPGGSSYLATASRDRTMKVWNLSASLTSFTSDTPAAPTRCTQVLQYRDASKSGTEWTAMTVTPNPINFALSTITQGGDFSRSSSVHAAQHLLYAATANGMVAAFSWNPVKAPGKLDLVAQTRPAQSNQQR